MDYSSYWDNIHKEYISTYDHWLDSYISKISKDSKIVEIGCGRAYNSKYLLEEGFSNITATDFSKEVLEIIKQESPELQTIYQDIGEPFPWENNSIDIIIADLCLHYFDKEKTKEIFKEIHRVLKKDGYLFARVNSTNDILHIPQSEEIDKNFYFDGKIYKRFFQRNDFEVLLKDFQIHTLEEKKMDRYVKPKVLWELCIQKKTSHLD